MCPRRCALKGVSFSTLCLGWYSQIQHVVKSVENAKHSETAGLTYEGTPATAWYMLACLLACLLVSWRRHFVQVLSALLKIRLLQLVPGKPLRTWQFQTLTSKLCSSPNRQAQRCYPEHRCALNMHMFKVRLNNIEVCLKTTTLRLKFAPYLSYITGTTPDTPNPTVRHANVYHPKCLVS